MEVFTALMLFMIELYELKSYLDMQNEVWYYENIIFIYSSWCLLVKVIDYETRIMQVLSCLYTFERFECELLSR